MSDLDNETIFKNAIENAGYATRSYSGRGMYGKSCLGFETSRGQSAIRATAEIMADLAETCQYDSDDKIEISDFLEFFSDVKEDSMGLGMIIYFPDIVWNEAWEEMGENTEEEDNRGMLRDCGIK